MEAVKVGELTQEKIKIRDKSGQLIWVNQAKILAALAVILLHINSGTVDKVMDVGSSSWWAGNYFDALTRWCVPVFVMVSGLLLLDPEKDESVSTFYKKRASKILAPLLFWTIFFLGLTCYINFTQGNRLSVMNLVNMTLMGQPYYHMWYLYMIIGLILVTPFLRIIVRHSSFKELVFLCVVLFIFSIAATAINDYFSNKEWPSILQAIFFLPYFLAGYLIGKGNRESHPGLMLVIFLAAAILIGIGNYCVVKAEASNFTGYFNKYLSITVVPLAVSAMFLLKRLRIPVISPSITNKLAILSFGVYLVHPVLIYAFKSFGVQVRPDNLFYSAPLVTILVFLVSLFAVLLIHLIPAVKRII